MAEADRGSTEAPLVTDEGTYSKRYTILCAGYPRADSLHYACIAVFGPQSSGKSTLLNDLFGTSFKMLNEDDGQQQTTRGITAGVIPSTEFSPTILLLDCEGSESGERAAAADQNIERRIGAFASVTADILIVNILQTDVGRAEGSCSNLLQSIFRVYFQLRNSQDGLYHRLKLFIAVRRCNEKGEEKMKASLFNKVRKMYEESVPDEFRERFTDFIDLNFWFIRDRRYENDEYMRQIGEIRIQLSDLAAEAVRQPASSGRLPLTLAESPKIYETIWGKICSNEDLDIPSMQEALSTKRCTEIASKCTEQLNVNLQSITIRTASTLQEVLDAQIDGLGIAQSLIDAVSDAALSFDNETRNYLDGPRTQQRDTFYQHTSVCLKSKAEGIVKRVVDTAVHLIDEVSKDAMSQTPRLATQDTLTVLKEVLEATDEMQGARPDGLDLKALELLHDPDFSYTHFVASRVAQRPRDASGILGLSQSICRGLLEWSIKIAASFGVLCDINEQVQRAEKRTNEQMDSVAKHFDNILAGQFDRFIQKQIRDSKANMSRAFRTGANVPHELNSIYGTLLEGGRRNLNTLCNSLGVTGQKSAALFLQRYSDAIGEEIKASILQVFTGSADGSIFLRLWRHMGDEAVRGGNPSTRNEIDSKYNRIKGELETYVRSFNKITLRDSATSTTFEINLSNEVQSNIVLEKMNHIWILAYDAMVFGLELKEKNLPGLIEKMHNSANELRRKAVNNQQEINGLDTAIDELQDTVQDEKCTAAMADAAADKCKKLSFWHFVPGVNIVYAIVKDKSASSHRNDARAADTRAALANSKIETARANKQTLYNESNTLTSRACDLNNNANNLGGIVNNLGASINDLWNEAENLAKSAMNLSTGELASRSNTLRSRLKSAMDDLVRHINNVGI